MNNTAILKIFLVLTIIGLVYIKYGANSLDLTVPTPSPQSQATPEPSSGLFTTFTTPYFTLDHPVESSASAVGETPDSLKWQITFVGQKQRESTLTNTELFDGYSVSVTKFETIEGDSTTIQAESDRQTIVDACGDDKATSIGQVNLGERQVISFYGGCLGESTYYYFEDRGSLYRLTSMVVGEGRELRQYQLDIETILSSFQII